MPPKYVSPREVAALTRLSPPGLTEYQVRGRLKAGWIVADRTPGQHQRIPLAEASHLLGRDISDEDWVQAQKLLKHHRALTAKHNLKAKRSRVSPYHPDLGGGTGERAGTTSNGENMKAGGSRAGGSPAEQGW